MSLTSNISKVLKKLIHKCLYHFLDQNEILYNNQYGFRNNYSAIHVLTDITEKTRNALGYKYHAFNIFIDLEKVFDTVNRTMGNVMFFFFFLLAIFVKTLLIELLITKGSISSVLFTLRK